MSYETKVFGLFAVRSQSENSRPLSWRYATAASSSSTQLPRTMLTKNLSFFVHNLFLSILYQRVNVWVITWIGNHVAGSKRNTFLGLVVCHSNVSFYLPSSIPLMRQMGCCVLNILRVIAWSFLSIWNRFQYLLIWYSKESLAHRKIWL